MSNTNNKTLSAKARLMLNDFEQKERQDGSKFYAIKDSSALKEKYQEICHEAHGDMMPDDFKYAFIVEALEQIADMTEDCEPIDCLYEIEADCYTSDLTKWLNSSNSRVYYLTEALEEYGIKDGFKALTAAQQKEKLEVALSILNSLENM